MADLDQKVRLDRVLEYAIFSNLPVTVALSQSPKQRWIVHVAEVMDSHFIAEVEAEGEAIDLRTKLDGKELTVMLGYKRQALSFAAQLEDSDRKLQPGQIAFTRPAFGTMTNQRRFPRLELVRVAPSVKAVIQVSTKIGELRFETRHLSDICQEAIALFFDRTQGLALPGDTVTNLLVYYNNDLVIETRGEILRVDMKRKSREMEKSYFVVVRFSSHARGKEKGNGVAEVKRDIERACLIGEKNSFVDAPHPLMREEVKIQGQIVDISTSGLSFLVKKTKFPIVPGTIFNELQIQLPHQDRLKAAFKVLYCQATTDDETYSYRIGGEFIGMSVELMKAISKTVQLNIDSRLSDATREDYEQLWEFFFETGFIYSQKRKQIQEFASKMLDTYDRLLKTDTPILRKIIFKEDEEIRGHVSAVRFYDHSWLVQHLSALKASDASAAQSVYKAMCGFFADPKANEKVGLSFMTCFFRPNNLYPAILFGEICKRTADPSICGIVDLEFSTLRDPTDVDTGPLEAVQDRPAIIYREATEKDLMALEELLIEQGQFQWMRIEGLQAESITRLSITKEFESIGLYRNRRVFVAESRDHDEGVYAICNYASPGVNLSELTNSIRLYFSNSASVRNQHLADAVVTPALITYETTDMPFPVFLSTAEQPIPRQFCRTKQYRYWYYDLNHVERFVELSEVIFQSMKQLLKEYSQNGRADKVA